MKYYRIKCEIYKAAGKSWERMAEELLRNFMTGMQDLGYKKDDIIFQIADYKEEE